MSKPISKLEKERTKLIQEKCLSMLNDLLRDEDNKYCVDCDAKGPRWASWNLGIFLCIRCAGIHRNLGVHISKVKSVNLDTWTPEQVVSMKGMGNSRGRAVYESNLPENFRRPQTDVSLENFIRGKYEHKKYIAKEWTAPPILKVDWTEEVDEQIRSSKKKPLNSGTISLFSKPDLSAARKIPQVEVKKEVTDLSKEVIDLSKEVTELPKEVTGRFADDLLSISESTLESQSVLSDVNFDGRMTKENIMSLYSNQAGNPFLNSGQQSSVGQIQSGLFSMSMNPPAPQSFQGPPPVFQQNNLFWK